MVMPESITPKNSTQPAHSRCARAGARSTACPCRGGASRTAPARRWSARDGSSDVAKKFSGSSGHSIRLTTCHTKKRVASRAVRRRGRDRRHGDRCGHRRKPMERHERELRGNEPGDHRHRGCRPGAPVGPRANSMAAMGMAASVMRARGCPGRETTARQHRRVTTRGRPRAEPLRRLGSLVRTAAGSRSARACQCCEPVLEGSADRAAGTGRRTARWSRRRQRAGRRMSARRRARRRSRSHSSHEREQRHECGYRRDVAERSIRG